MEETSDNDDRIPITEWPMFSENEEPESQTQKCVINSWKEAHAQVSKSNHSPLPTKQRTLPSYKRTAELTHLEIPTKYQRKSKDDTSEGYLEPMAAVRVAKWWRKNQHLHKHLKNESCNANTRLYCISRMRECHQYLENEKSYLKKKSSTCCEPERAPVYAALASIEDWLDLHASALENITKAVVLNKSNPEFLWLQAKLSRQQRMIEIQNEMTTKLSPELRSFPTLVKVDRISMKHWSPQDIKDRFVKRRIPVIIEDAVCEMTKENWDLDYIKKRAGSITVPVKQHVFESVEWAKLEESRSITIADHIDKISTGKTTDYLFDWSLPLHCPDLAKELTLPPCFSDNFLTKTEPGSLYHDSWPSLFIAPAGVTSALHVDAFASGFWMALFQGEKRWTFFDASDLALLYPKYIHSLDPVFNVNIAKPDLKSYPLMALTQPKQCVLKAGDLLYVPSGSPHFVENLTASLAISSNYVDATNFHKVCEELQINGLIDPRAKQLLEQFQSLDFKGRNMPEET